MELGRRHAIFTLALRELPNRATLTNCISHFVITASVDLVETGRVDDADCVGATTIPL